MAYSVTIRHDNIKHVYYVISSDIPGLHAESSSADELFDIIHDLAPDLLDDDAANIRIEFRVEPFAAHA
jgi:hypothetical protein